MLRCCPWFRSWVRVIMNRGRGDFDVSAALSRLDGRASSVGTSTLQLQIIAVHGRPATPGNVSRRRGMCYDP